MPKMITLPVFSADESKRAKIELATRVAMMVWKKTRPPAIRALADRFDPWSLFLMKSTGHRVIVIGFDEVVGGSPTVRVAVLAKYNLIGFERQVFGIDPDDLEPCDPPGPDEPVGAEMTQEEARDNMDEMRVRVRPDLWVLDANGKAVRKQ